MSEITKCLLLLNEAIKLLNTYNTINAEEADIALDKSLPHLVINEFPYKMYPPVKKDDKKDDKVITVLPTDTKKIKGVKAKKEDTRTPEERTAAREKMAKLRELRKSKPKAETKLDAVST